MMQDYSCDACVHDDSCPCPCPTASGGALSMSPDRTAFIVSIKKVFYLCSHPQFDDNDIQWNQLEVTAKFSKDLRKVYIPWDSDTASDSLTCWDIQEYLWLLSQQLERTALQLGTLNFRSMFQTLNIRLL